MLERSKKILRLACLVLAALVVYQLAEVVLRINPLARVKIPELPSLPPDTNAPPVGARPGVAPNIAAMGGGTNNPSARGGTNLAATNTTAGTNAAENVSMASGTNTRPRRGGTNMAAVIVAAETNVASPTASTNADTRAVQPTNSAGAGTNLAAHRAVVLTNTNGTVVLAGAQMGTNSMRSAGTNVVLSATNAAGRGAGARGQIMAGGPNAGPRAAGGRRGVDLPPAIQARVDRIAESEILGAIIRPPPMALLGIAGNFAILRTPTGQTGLVKEGDELGGLKLVRIGTNRVLVEEQGQQKELTIYSGFGGESLLPKQETPK